MSEQRLYLYRKAGREVWDAEMWLSDGRRRVWRTGIVDRAQAEQAARVRQNQILGSITDPMVAESVDVRRAPNSQPAEAPAEHPEGRPILVGPPAETAVSPAAPRVPLPGWGVRFDRWFFGDLKALFG